MDAIKKPRPSPLSLPVDAIIGCLEAEQDNHQQRSTTTSSVTDAHQWSLNTHVSPSGRSMHFRCSATDNVGRSVGRVQSLHGSTRSAHVRRQSSSVSMPMSFSTVRTMLLDTTVNKTELDIAQNVFGQPKVVSDSVPGTASTQALEVPSYAPAKAAIIRSPTTALPTGSYPRPTSFEAQPQIAPTRGRAPEQPVPGFTLPVHVLTCVSNHPPRPLGSTTEPDVDPAFATVCPAHLSKADVIERHIMSPARSGVCSRTELMTHILESPEQRAIQAWPDRSALVMMPHKLRDAPPVLIPPVHLPARRSTAQTQSIAGDIADLQNSTASRLGLGKRKRIVEPSSDVRMSKSARSDASAALVDQSIPSGSRRSSIRLSARTNSNDREPSPPQGQKLDARAEVTDSSSASLDLLPSADISERTTAVGTSETVMEIEKTNRVRDCSADTSALTEVGNESLAQLQSMLTRMAMPRNSSVFLAEHRRTSMLHRFGDATNMLGALVEVPEKALARPVQRTERKVPRYAAATASSTARARNSSGPQVAQASQALSRVSRVAHSSSPNSLIRRGSLLSIASNIRAAQAANARGDSVATTGQSEGLPVIGASAATGSVTPKSPHTAATHSRPTAGHAIATLLKGVVAYVDVKTAEGDDAGGVFVDILRSLGARVLVRFSDNVTHVIFKGGRATTITRCMMFAEPRPFLLGVGWVVSSREMNSRAAESDFAVAQSLIDTLLREAVPSVGGVVGARRRRTLEPRLNDVRTDRHNFPRPLADVSNATATALMSKAATTSGRQTVGYAPKKSSPLKQRAFMAYQDSD